MTRLQDHDEMMTINMALFRRFHFYQLFDPDGPRAFGYRVHRTLGVVSCSFVMAVNLFSALAVVFADTGTPVDDVDALLARFLYATNCITFVKAAVFLLKPDAVWRLYDSTRVGFLTSGRCRARAAILYARRDTAIRMTDYFLAFTSAVLTVWCCSPLLHNALAAAPGPGRRYQNAFNMAYPVPVAVYNRYFAVFYAMEVAMGLFQLYFSVIVDLFVLSVCVATAAQYEVLAAAFASVGHRADGRPDGDGNDGYENNSLNAYKNFKLIIDDQIRVFKTLETFYSVVRIIVVVLIFTNSISLIILSYSFIKLCVMAETFSMIIAIKIFTGYFVFVYQSFLYCYFFNAVTDKKESVNFGIISCNWTKMDLKFNKLLLMTMLMNNANSLMIKMSPTKIINLQFFASVMSTTYNIVSVMLNREWKNLKEAGL